MKTPYTPGPWSYHEPMRQPVPSELELPSVVGLGGPIAKVQACANPALAFKDKNLTDLGDTPGCEGWPVGLAIAQANARLIALAPEMADAIVAYVDEIGSHTTEGGLYISPELMAVLNLAVRIREIKGLEPTP